MFTTQHKQTPTPAAGCDEQGKPQDTPGHDPARTRTKRCVGRERLLVGRAGGYYGCVIWFVSPNLGKLAVSLSDGAVRVHVSGCELRWVGVELSAVCGTTLRFICLPAHMPTLPQAPLQLDFPALLHVCTSLLALMCPSHTHTTTPHDTHPHATPLHPPAQATTAGAVTETGTEVAGTGTGTTGTATGTGTAGGATDGTAGEEESIVAVWRLCSCGMLCSCGDTGLGLGSAEFGRSSVCVTAHAHTHTHLVCNNA